VEAEYTLDEAHEHAWILDRKFVIEILNLKDLNKGKYG